MIKILLVVIVTLAACIQAISCTPIEADTIKIGCVLSLSGELGPKGEDRMNAARLAVEEINAEGGVLGKEVQLLERDDSTDADKCLEQVRKLVSSDGVKVIIGGMSSGAAIATGPYLAEKEVLMISPSATAPEISDYEWTNWFFRTTPHDAFQGKALAEIVLKKGFVKLATIVHANPYGKGLENALIEALKEGGWAGKHVIAIYFDPGKRDYLTQLQNIKDSAPDVVLAVTYVEDGIAIFKQALDMGLDEIAWLGCDGNYGDRMFVDPKCAEFMEKAIIAGTRFASPLAGTTYDNFAAAYKTATGREPSVYCDTTYDSIKMLAGAIEQAGVYDGAAIRDALLEVGQKYRGASGVITFDAKGDRVSGIFEIWKVDKNPNNETGYQNYRIDIVRIG